MLSETLTHKHLDNCSNFAVIGHSTSQASQILVQMVVHEFKEARHPATSIVAQAVFKFLQSIL